MRCAPTYSNDLEPYTRVRWAESLGPCRGPAQRLAQAGVPYADWSCRACRLR